MSAEDIEKGARWSSQITTELNSTDFGVICLTPENTTSPWIHFEAGSLAKVVDRSKVVPILFKLEPSDVQGPLTQFQMANFDKDEMCRLLKSINNSAGESKIADLLLERSFEHFWPELNDEIQKVDFASKGVSQPSEVGNVENSFNSILEEILVTTRTLSIKSNILDEVSNRLIDRFNRTERHTEVNLAATAERLAERIEELSVVKVL